MEIDDLQYLNLETSKEEYKTSTNLFMKQTLVYSPIFIDIFLNFHVLVGKRIKDVRGLSLQDDNDQYLALQNDDSQFSNFGDSSQFPRSPSREQRPQIKTKIVTITVIVKASSLLVDDIEYPFNSRVRSCCIIKGLHNDNIQEEDSLLVSLKSGFILLIRMFSVPITFNDNDYTEEFSQDLVLKPFVVQWWDTGCTSHTPHLFTSGQTVISHSSGLAVVSMAMSGSFRIHHCDHLKSGVMLKPHYTVPINGTIIQSCFSQPIKGSVLDDHVMLLVLTLTNNSKLELQLYGWSTSDALNQSLTKAILPLALNFPLPVFITSLKNDGSFLYVTPHEFIIITVHDVTSADYNFKRFEFTGSFPTNYHHPKSFILGNEDTEEMLVSTDNGTIYSIITEAGDLKITPIIRISDPISVFTLEKIENGYDLIYGSDMGLNRRLFLEKLFDEDAEPYSQSLLVDNYKNWAPIIDVEIIKSYKSRNSCQNSKQELWCLSGTGKRSRLTQLRKGYCASRITDPYQSLRKAEKMFYLKYHDVTYITCSLPFETVFLEYEETELIEVNDAALVYNSCTLLMEMIDDHTAIQITPNSVLVTDIETILFTQKFDNILFAHILDNYVLLVSHQQQQNIEVYKVLNEDLQLVHSFNMDFEISLAKLLPYNGITICIGNFDGDIQFLSLDNMETFRLSLTSTSNILETTSVSQDIIMTQSEILIGTQDGYLFWYNKDFKLVNSFKLNDVGVSIHQRNDVVLISCNSIWMLDFSKQIPEPVLFDEKNDKAVKSMLIVENTHLSMSILVVRDEGLSIASVSRTKAANVKQISVGDSAKKVMYLPYLAVFMLLSDSKHPKSRIRYVDRKTYKLLSHEEIGKLVFDANEIPICAKIWSVERFGKTSKKLLIGCCKDNGGAFKILHVTKLVSDNKVSMTVEQLIGFNHKAPITCIEQVGANIIFSSNNKVYSTIYDTEEKRLKPIKELLTLPSDIISILVQNDKIVSILTKLDSIFQFEFSKQLYEDALSLVGQDPSPKSVINHAVTGSKVFVGEKYHSDIVIMSRSDKSLEMEKTFKSVGIPRVFTGNFEYYWVPSNENNNSVVCVSIDGEIVLLKEAIKNSKEYTDLNQHFLHNNVITLPTQIWDAAFVDKVTGKGFKSINKPYFRNTSNKDIIDFDLDEVSRVCVSHNLL